MTFDYSVLQLPTVIEPSAKYLVGLPNGTRTYVKNVGSVVLDKNLHLLNVLHVPDFHHNLLSVSKLTASNNCFVTFYLDFCLIQDLCNGKLKGIGKHRQGLYFFNPNLKLSTFVSDLGQLNKVVCHTVESSQVVPFEMNLNKMPISMLSLSSSHDSALWHQRLGHASYSILPLVRPSLSRSSAQSSLHFMHCLVYPLAKQTRLPFPNSTFQTQNL